MDAWLALIEHGLRLKLTPRSGWVQRGVPQAESVAAHSYGVALTTLLLAQLVDRPLDLARALQMAILHDLPEALTGDIARPVQRFFPSPERSTLKQAIERNALRELTADLPLAAAWQALWDELEAEVSAEAQLVHDADQLDLYAQAWAYEQQTGNRRLAEFWERPPQFHFAAARVLYDALWAQRTAER